ncbi:putative F-box/LRR-repeat protein At5g54820 [Lycium barbarum]|uniref:putative F-box/LRR-repeat protein At5g54820 n=1 Tax=Lycium barbarum TaxID=112863 RepID=UPI00293F7523|nr:putative F-box/LRR-repeat protein At5g54820 [Lycium barbarum]
MEEISDRFSSLPEPVVLHILSFLPFDDVVQTSLLYKQCTTLWTICNALNFIHRPVDSISLRKFVSFVDKSLINLHCNTNGFSKLHLDFPFKRCFSSDVTVWVIFAVKHKVKELNLILSNDDDDKFSLPKRVFVNSFLEKVNWVGCKFDMIEVVRCDSLRELRMGSMECSDEMVKKFISGSPCLELLELDNCWGFKRLDLVDGKVSKLVVNGHNEVKMVYDFELEINAPCVKVLELKGCLGMNIKLRNVMKCVSVKLDYQFKTPDDEERDEFYHRQRQMLMNMLMALRHVKDVMLGTWCIEVMASWGMQYMPFTMGTCECLTLHTPIQERYLPGIVWLLQSAFNLRTLIIHMATPYFEFETCFIPGLNNCFSTRGMSRLSMLPQDWGVHLKKIRICGFEGMRSGQEVLFLCDLLLISANLEIMVIEWRAGHHNPTSDESDEFVTESLISVQRRSKNSMILFKYY